MASINLVWCTYAAVRDGLGWATGAEGGFDTEALHCENGLLLRTDQWTWVLDGGGAWEQR